MTEEEENPAQCKDTDTAVGSKKNEPQQEIEELKKVLINRGTDLAMSSAKLGFAFMGTYETDTAGFPIFGVFLQSIGAQLDGR